MATLKYMNYANLSLLIFLSFLLWATARPATFLQDFRITWSDSHIRQIEGGRAIQLVLDQNSGTPSPICFMWKKCMPMWVINHMIMNHNIKILMVNVLLLNVEMISAISMVLKSR